MNFNIFYDQFFIAPLFIYMTSYLSHMGDKKRVTTKILESIGKLKLQGWHFDQLKTQR